MRKAPNPVVSAGRIAYVTNVELDKNPYQRGSESCKAWARGWHAEKRNSRI